MDVSVVGNRLGCEFSQPRTREEQVPGFRQFSERPSQYTMEPSEIQQKASKRAPGGLYATDPRRNPGAGLYHS